MPRLKRAQKLAMQPGVKPIPAPKAPSVVAEKIVGCFCPVCGKTIHQFRAIKAGYITIDQIRYFSSIDWDPSKPFGITFDAAGRGSLQNWTYIGPEEAPELFEALKGRFLQGLAEWLAKGWITREELTHLLEGK